LIGIGRTALGPLRFLLVASVVGPVLLFIGVAWYDYRATYRGAEHELTRASEVAREHAAKVFDSDKLVADHAIDIVRGMDEAAIVASEASLHERFRGIIDELPQVQSLLLVGRDGDALVSAGIHPIAHAFNVADRDYFEALRDTPLDIYLSAIFVGRYNEAPAFSVARRRMGPDGHFGGIVSVGVSPEYFSGFDQTLIGEGGVVRLVREDGQLIIGYPPLREPGRSLPADNPLFAAIAARPAGNVYRDDSSTDRPRLFAFSKVLRYPAYVVIGRPIASIQAEWERDMLGELSYGLPTTAALFLLTLTALRRTKRAQAAVIQAEQEIRRREVAEAALRQAQKLEAIGQLTGGVAHDFNNLLTAVLGNLELVEMRLGDERLRTMVQTASRAAMRGAALTQQLLAFSRKQHLVPVPVDLNATVEALAEMLGRTLGGTVEIAKDLEPDLWPALIDPTQIELAALNLVINARDAMPSGGTVLVATRNLAAADVPRDRELLAGDYVVLSVEDTGEGMSEEVKAHAFEPFYTTKQVGKGSGLGLSQVYGLAHQSGGTVVIDSTLGHGTRIEIVLPRAISVRATAEPSPVADVFERRQGMILVVDDQEDVRTVAMAQLATLGYRTIEASSGEAAHDIVRSSVAIDLLLADYAMPGMNGAELLRAVRLVRPGLPAVLMTGYAEPRDLVEGLEGVSLLRKPYRIHELAARVEGTLRNAALAARPPGAERAVKPARTSERL
jgi:two-component system, NtrC family, sensor kinase